MHAYCHDDSDIDFFDSLQHIAINHLCADQYFLDSANLEADTCKKAVDLNIEKCWSIVEPLEPTINRDDSDFSAESTRKFSSFSEFYVMCLQTKILLPRPDGK